MFIEKSLHTKHIHGHNIWYMTFISLEKVGTPQPHRDKQKVFLCMFDV